MNIIRVGTRGSKLALVQANHIIDLIKSNQPDLKIELIKIKTTGDIDKLSPLNNVGDIGVFTKQIELELQNRSIDIAVHSAKDLPSVDTTGLIIGAVPARALCEDVWISRQGLKLSDIDPNSIVGTSSPRRRAMLLNQRPDLHVRNIRGNIETRLRKLNDGDYDALVMAHAGLQRLGLDDKITEALSPESFIPAPGQGALAVQIRNDDETISRLVNTINHPPSFRCLKIERMLLQILKAGCSAAVGGLTKLENNKISLSAVVLDRDGKNRLFASNKIASDQPDEMLVDEVTKSLFAQGAKALIDS